MLRKNGGVTLIVLVITVIVLSIIVSITVITGDQLLRNTQKNALKSNLYLIKSRAETLLEDYLFDGTDNLGAKATKNKVEKVGWVWDNAETSYIYRSWNLRKLEEQGIDIENVSAEGEFLIQYNIKNDSVDVASTIGFKAKSGQVLFTLSELIEDDKGQ